MFLTPRWIPRTKRLLWFFTLVLYNRWLKANTVHAHQRLDLRFHTRDTAIVYFLVVFGFKTIEGPAGFQFFCTCRCVGFVDIVLHTLQVSNVWNRTHEGAADAVEMSRHVAIQWPFCYVLLSLRWHFSDLLYGY